MITRKYYGMLVDNNLIHRGDYQRIADICNEKKLKGIDGGVIERIAIHAIITKGRKTTNEITNVILEYYNERLTSLSVQQKAVKK